MALCHTSEILTFNKMVRHIKKTDRDKPWARKALARDVSIIRQAHNIFLIYCEGENTEPEYFRSFPVNTETLVEAVGLGMSRTALVQRIIRLAGEKEMLPGQRQHDPDRQIWAVFDHDNRGEGESNDFDEAVSLATANGLRVAYSNDAFELWFFLHDAYVDGQLNRDHYFTHLFHLPRPTAGSDPPCSTIIGQPPARTPAFPSKSLYDGPPAGAGVECLPEALRIKPCYPSTLLATNIPTTSRPGKCVSKNCLQATK